MRIGADPPLGTSRNASVPSGTAICAAARACVSGTWVPDDCVDWGAGTLSGVVMIAVNSCDLISGRASSAPVRVRRNSKDALQDRKSVVEGKSIGLGWRGASDSGKV